MFGYIRPYKSELLMKDYEFYKAIYCSVCKRLGNNFGFFSRFSLTYDSTFIAILSLSLKEECCGFVYNKCVVNPLKKCKFCIDGMNEIDISSAVCIIMAYYKLKDNLKDGNFLEQLKSWLVYPFFMIPYKRAFRKFKDIDDIIKNYIDEQDKVESKLKPSIDESAEPTALMIKRLFNYIYYKEPQRDTLANFGYFLGKWIYFIDAADDIEKDIQSKNFNPFVINKIGNNNIDIKEVKEYCNQVLNQSISRAIEHYRSLNIYHFKSIIDNIVNIGLPMMQKQVIFDRR